MDSWSRPGNAALLHWLQDEAQLGLLSDEDRLEILRLGALDEPPPRLDLELVLAVALSSVHAWSARSVFQDDALEALEAVHRRLLDSSLVEHTVRFLSYPALSLLIQAGRPEPARDLARSAHAATPVGGQMRPYLAYALIDRYVALEEYRRAAEVAAETLAEAEDDETVDAALVSSLRGMAAHIDVRLGLPDRAAEVFRADHLFQQGRRAAGNANWGFFATSLIHLIDLHMAASRYADVREFEPVLADEELFEQRPDVRPYLLVRLGVSKALLALETAVIEESETLLAQAEAWLTEALAHPRVTEGDRLTGELWLAYVAQREGRWDEAVRLLGSARGKLPADSPELRREGRLASVFESRAAAAGALTPDRARAARRAVAESFEALLAGWTSRATRAGGAGRLLDVQDRWLVAERLRGEPPERAFELLARVDSTATLARDLGAHVPTLGDVRAHLPPGGGVLFHFPLHFEPTIVLVLDHDGVSVLRTASRQESTGRLRSFTGLLRRAPPAEPAARAARLAKLREVGGSLVDDLLPDEARAAVERWDTVVVVGADLLEGLPWEALPWADSWLGVEKAVVQRLSLALGVALAERAATYEPREFRATLFVDPVLGPDVRAHHPELRALGWGESEIGRLRRPFGAEAWRVLAGEDARWSALADAPRASYLHLVTHGVQDPSRERSAALVGAPEPDGRGRLVRAADVEAVDAMPGLVLLSSCGAGQGPPREGDGGASDLSGAFLRAGADTVVLSPTDLDAEAMLALAPVFQAALAEGAPPAEALRRGRAALAEREAFADPFHHGLLAAVGLGTRPLAGAASAVDEREGRVPLLAGGGAVLLALVAWAGFRRRATSAG